VRSVRTAMSTKVGGLTFYLWFTKCPLAEKVRSFF